MFGKVRSFSQNSNIAVLQEQQGFIPCSTKKRPSTVLFVGATGAGKSTICNYLYDLGETQMFIEAATGNHYSTTQSTSLVEIEIKNSLYHNGNIFTFMDTPGLNENIMKDIAHVHELYKIIQQVVEISVIVLVIPYNFKFDIAWIQTMSFFRDAFKPLFEKGRSCIALTHMSSEDFKKLEEGDGFKMITKTILQECNAKLGNYMQVFVVTSQIYKNGVAKSLQYFV